MEKPRKAFVTFVTGDRHEILYTPGENFGAEEFTVATIHRRTMANGHQLIFQGDKVVCIEFV